MDDQSSVKPEEIPPGGRSPMVLVCDASAELSAYVAALRVAGYIVADVAMASLSSRVTTLRPNVVILDVDVDGVLDELAKLRRVPGSGAIDFVYVGTGEGVVKNADDALSNDGSAFFVRPVEVAALVRKIEALTGGAVSRPGARRSSRPPSIPSQRLLGSSLPPSERPSHPSLPAPGLRTPGPPLPMSTSSLADLIEAPRSLAAFGTVSHELQQLLADAEMRAEVASSAEIPLPSPEEEIEAVLPADVLASLDEPIEGDEDEEGAHEGQPRTGSGGHDREGTGAHAKGTTSGGTRQSTTGGGMRISTGSQTRERRAGSDAPPRSVSGAPTTTTGTHGARRGTDVNAPSPGTDANARAPAPPEVPDLQSTRADPPARHSSWLPPAPPAPPHDAPRGPSVVSAAQAGAVVLGPTDARRFFAEAIARRATGALCFEQDGAVRRIVMRDGDLVAAASGAEQESLVHFLASRGELPRDEAPRLAAKIPPYGRHAGAALVAHGWLRQDQLWSILRAHAEWIAKTILRLPRGTAQLEPDPPGRLRGEPSVFGASTGAEIFVELVRRAVPVEEAVERLGGEGARIDAGANHGLLAECNLSPQDLDVLQRVRGGSLSDLLARHADHEIVAVIHALALLGIFDVVAPAVAIPRRPARAASEPDVHALDEDAIRARVRARLELVEEGDYFAVLGVTRDATGYEIRHAFLELRRAFEPSRLLTPHLLDLTSDVQKIVVVIEEAYEILRDSARRERYRRAIDARPG
ncbi:MAG: hypothetical protein KF819_40035 [Labilithrix sp.]|nr:hypothetical protein [Labilithrix sp.]